MVRHRDWQRGRREDDDGAEGDGGGGGNGDHNIPRGGSAGYLLGQVSLMTWAVGEAASQPAVGGRG